MLWTRVGVPIETTKAGRERHPAFRRAVLRELDSEYAGVPGWEGLVGHTDQPLFDFAKDLRDDFTHARRVASELHGDEFTTFAQGDNVNQGITAGDHLAIGLAFYDDVLRTV
jgi:hypothetical protein